MGEDDGDVGEDDGGVGVDRGNDDGPGGVPAPPEARGRELVLMVARLLM